MLREVESNPKSHADDELRRASRSLDSRDAGLAEQIVFGVLRYRQQLDWLIDQRSKHALDTEVRIALRMGIFQIRYLDRIPPHAAVSETVEMVKREGFRSASGLVNALLRRTDRNPVHWPDRETRLSCPEWLLARWEAQFGADLAEGIALAALEVPVSYQRGERTMDIGAQSIVPLLDLQPGDRLLDLCSAPGNKTLQAMETEGVTVVAADNVFARLRQVPTPVRVLLDARYPLPFRPLFDKVLVDAPCSGTGTLGRNPEIKWRLRPEEFERQQARQKQILAMARAVLKPGGRLVYATCSLEPEENEQVAGAGTHRIPGREAGDGFFAAVLG